MFLLTLAATRSPQPDPMDAMDWDVHPRMVGGEILVAPVITVSAPPEPNLTGIVGERLDPVRAEGRIRRTKELAALPEAFHDAVPGALYSVLPPDWRGHFRDTALGWGEQVSLGAALTTPQRSFPATMAQVARGYAGSAMLFTWVVETAGRPLTSEHLVGELVMQDGIPVVVDHRSEPYAVSAELGIALVARDGEVLFRYQDEYEALLTDGSPLNTVARQLARDLVRDITPLWLGLATEETMVAGL